MTSVVECGIIGGGIFGSIIAKKLHTIGKSIIIVDSDENKAGSKAAACLMKPSWYSSLGKEIWQPAMRQLEELYFIEEIKFQTKIGKVNVTWINPNSILRKTHEIAKINRVVSEYGQWFIYEKDQEIPIVVCNTLILAAGIWSNNILYESGIPLVEDLSPRTGTSFRIKGVTEPKIHAYAPYRQSVKFNISPNTIWTGDGVANKNYDVFHLSKSIVRCAQFVGCSETLLSATTGHRPYVKDAKPCYLKEHAPGLWVVTGGAKNGTIAAGWAAHRLGEILS